MSWSRRFYNPIPAPKGKTLAVRSSKDVIRSFSLQDRSLEIVDNRQRAAVAAPTWAKKRVISKVVLIDGAP